MFSALVILFYIVLYYMLGMPGCVCVCVWIVVSAGYPAHCLMFMCLVCTCILMTEINK